jgi:hypothetical protein
MVRTSATAVMLAVLTSPTQADSSNTTFVTVKTGFAGKWSINEHPTIHHRVECEPIEKDKYLAKPRPCFGNISGDFVPNGRGGDWSVDYYVKDASSTQTEVIYNAATTGGTLQSYVWATYPTCSDGLRGTTVFIDVYVSGSWEGWVSFGHLDDVHVTPGVFISPGTRLGQTKQWPYSKCFKVKFPTGVHTHVEMWNKRNFSCFKGYTSGDPLPSGAPLGIIGQTAYADQRKQCQ